MLRLATPCNQELPDNHARAVALGLHLPQGPQWCRIYLNQVTGVAVHVRWRSVESVSFSVIASRSTAPVVLDSTDFFSAYTYVTGYWA